MIACEWLVKLPFVLLLCTLLSSPVQPTYAQATTEGTRAANAGDSEHLRAVAWDNSAFVGTPEAPLPLTIEPAFAQLKFNDPMHIRWQADVGRYFVCELGGKLWSFPHDPQVAQADLVVDLKGSITSFDPERHRGVDSVYSLVFDPNFEQNRFVYVCMIFSPKGSEPLDDGSRISRFEVSRTNPPTIDVQTELPIISWLGGGHNGCDLAFDNSGCLLISTGDATAPAPPDGLNTGQDCSDLLASILRIDVRQATPEQPYQIPSDNPFVERTGVRPEIWAFGFRNPWRIAIDRLNGDLWLGDVGWEKWEMVHRVVRGGNYGWSIREGIELLRPDVTPGPTPVLPPRVVLPHTDSASITGGFVYRGSQLKAIANQYLFGDWTNGRIWAVPVDERSPHAEVASGQLRIVAFEPDRDGEPLIVNHLGNTTLFRLVPNFNYEAELIASTQFPRRLSDSGLFTDVAGEQVAPGVVPFEINQPQWQDGAVGAHWLAVPGRAPVTVYNSPQPLDVLAMFNSRLHYPPGTVLAKTLTMPAEPARQRFSAVKLETQVLHFDGRLWRGYSYRWNERQDDADLVEAAGVEFVIPGSDSLRWRIHSRSDCLLCHNPWPETTLAFTPEQLHQPERGSESTWLKLVAAGLVVTKQSKEQAIAPESCVRQPLVADGDDLSLRARSYLHVNCAHCHQNGAGAGVTLSLRMQDALTDMLAIGVQPTKGGFGILDGQLIAAGEPTRSALVYRLASSSIGHMPHIGAREVDLAGVALISDWIAGLRVEGSPKQLDFEKVHFERQKIDEISLSTRGQALLTSLATATAGDSPAVRSQRVQEALRLAIDLARFGASEARPSFDKTTLVKLWLNGLANSSDPIIASLFEAHLPPSERERRLSPLATYADVASLTGDASRGRAYFFDTTTGSQCSQCHRIGDRGGQVGPALDDIGLRQTAAQIFESIMDPSRVIDSRYQSQQILTTDERVISGLLVESNGERLVLINAQGERMEIPTADIDTQRPASSSLMPGGLGAGMTAQQMADVLAYLSDLKESNDAAVPQ